MHMSSAQLDWPLQYHLSRPTRVGCSADPAAAAVVANCVITTLDEIARGGGGNPGFGELRAKLHALFPSVRVRPPPAGVSAGRLGAPHVASAAAAGRGAGAGGSFVSMSSARFGGLAKDTGFAPRKSTAGNLWMNGKKQPSILRGAARRGARGKTIASLLPKWQAADDSDSDSSDSDGGGNNSTKSAASRKRAGASGKKLRSLLEEMGGEEEEDPILAKFRKAQARAREEQQAQLKMRSISVLPTSGAARWQSGR